MLTLTSNALIAGVVIAAAFGEPGDTPAPAFPQVIDGHADFAIHYLKKGWAPDAYDIEHRLPGQSDVPRWRLGRVNGALATVGSDLPPGSRGHHERVLASIDWFDGVVGRHSSALLKARNSADFEAAARAGQIALMPAVEGGEQIDGSLDNLRELYRRGVRSMTIVYDQHNAIGDGAMAMPASRTSTAPSHGGLSAFGRELVAEMNRLGLIVDLSHAAESTALMAIAASRAPVIFSHSGARALADTPRNLSDATLRAVAEKGGLVMVTLVPYLTTTDHWRWWLSGEERYEALKSQGGGKAAISHGMAEWDAANPEPSVTMAHVADQIEYIARVAGRDHVGIGTDFDGMDSFVIRDLSDASALPKLFEELARRGWGSADLEKLARGNFLRVLRGVESASAKDLP